MGSDEGHEAVNDYAEGSMRQRSNKRHGVALFAIMLLPLLLLEETPGLDPAATTGSTSTMSSYIVQATSAADAEQLVIEAGGTVTATLNIINGVGADLTEKQAAWLSAQPDRVTVYSDGVLEVSGPIRETDFPTLVGADTLHEQGITGKGITIAVLDTGLWKSPGMEFSADGVSRILAQHDVILDDSYALSGCDDDEYDDECDDDDCDDGGCRIVQAIDLDDWNGHGTHITSIIMGSGRTEAGRFQGIAPNANVVAVRAFEPDGSGTYLNVIKALDWIVSHRHQYDIRVLNLSFGAPAASHYWDDPVNQAVMAAWSRGIIVVTAAGNTGPGPMTVGVPGNVPYVITVGAMTDNHTPHDTSDDRLAAFSAAGPTVEGFVKPELVAPGGHMLGQMPPYAWLPLEHPEFVQPFGDYFRMSGTSQSAAVVSGVLALMLEIDPQLSPNDAKCRLMKAAKAAIRGDGTHAYSVFQQGAGLVDAIAATNHSAKGCANRGMSVYLDLWRIRHYAGPAGVDANGTYYLIDDQGARMFGSAYEWNQATLWPEGALWPEAPVAGAGVLWNTGVKWYATSSLNPDSLMKHGALWPEGSLWPEGLSRPASTYVWVHEE